MTISITVGHNNNQVRPEKFPNKISQNGFKSIRTSFHAKNK